LFLDEDANQILNQLGLTILEARIYLALCKYESLTAKALSKLTTTSQPDIYRIIARLQKKGLIEKIIKKPAQFRAIQLATSIPFLLERKKSEYIDLKVKSELLLREVKEKPTPLETENSQYALIPQSPTIVKRIEKAIERSKRSVDIVLSQKRFLTDVSSYFAKSLERAWNREVKFRMIIESLEEGEAAELAVQFVRKSPFCNIRFLPDPPKTILGIYDKREVFIIADPKKSLFDSPALWSNNESLTSLVQDYFEILWLTAMKESIRFPQPS
jgi:sugar-specific transcriptional regulator TrmB